MPAFAPVERPGSGSEVDVGAAACELELLGAVVCVELDEEVGGGAVLEEPLPESEVLADVVSAGVVVVFVSGSGEEVVGTELEIVVLVEISVVGTLRSWAESEDEEVTKSEDEALTTAVGDPTLEIEAYIDPEVMSRNTASLRSQQYLLAFRFSSQHHVPSEQS